MNDYFPGLAGAMVRFRSWLAEFDYKPGWAFEFFPERSVIRVTMEVQDAYHPERIGKIANEISVPPYVLARDDVNEFLNFMRDFVIRRTEQHETDEWIKFQGRRIFDPHAKPDVVPPRLPGSPAMIP